MSTICYDLKKIRAFVFDVDGVLSPNTVPLNHDGEPSRMANVKDGYALHFALKHGYKIAIISGARTETVARRFHLLGIADVFLYADDKLPILKEWMKREKLTAEQVVYVGDDIPDIPCMKYAGLSVAPADASTDALAAAVYRSPVNGGAGVARDVIEQTMRAQRQWLMEGAEKW